MSREQLSYLLRLVKGGMLERATAMIEQELAKPEQKPVCNKDPSLCGFVQCQLGKVCKHTAQSEQEPYCWVQSKLSQGMFYKEKPKRIHTIPLYTASPKREQLEQSITPISTDQYERLCFTCGACLGKPWVGLTNKEIEDLDDFDYCEYGYPNNFVRAIEAKLKELNT